MRKMTLLNIYKSLCPDSQIYFYIKSFVIFVLNYIKGKRSYEDMQTEKGEIF